MKGTDQIPYQSLAEDIAAYCRDPQMTQTGPLLKVRTRIRGNHIIYLFCYVLGFFSHSKFEMVGDQTIARTAYRNNQTGNSAQLCLKYQF